MDSFYSTQLSEQELRQQLTQPRDNREVHGRSSVDGQNMLSAQPGQSMPTMNDTPMIGGGSLDDIIRNGQHEAQRRQSIPQSYGANQHVHESAQRRVSMMEFANNIGGFGNFSLAEEPLSANFTDDIASMGQSLPISTTLPNYATQDMLTLGGQPNFSSIQSGMMSGAMPATFAGMSMGQMDPEASGMSLFGSPGMTVQYSPTDITSSNDFMSLNVQDSPINATSSNVASALRLGGEDPDMMGMSQPFVSPSSASSQGSQAIALGNVTRGLQPNMPSTLSSGVSAVASFQSLPGPQAQNRPPTNVANLAHPTPVPMMGPTPPAEQAQKSIYSKSGFDMVKALWYVGARKNPEIHLGSVDFSCAFVVCDVTMNDCPIIYVSDNFQNLTGYSRHEILGQNCRFLQAPDGKVEAGSKREFVDDTAVYNLKKKIAEGKEVQQSLINYRKGGKPFLNLLTMIPIPWDTEDIRYFVGFQIDLVECPDAIASGNDSGGVQVNYKHSDIGQYIWTPPPAAKREPENGQTLGLDDISTLLQQFDPNGVVSDWHRQSWDKMLLENSDDVVHVLSLKGLFLYLSPSCKRILEYDVADLVGSSLSTVCHPSDIVPVTRELKDTTVEAPVNLVFRIRRKNSGYTWFESHGSLFVEQGKGRKCIILVGRKRPVLSLSRSELDANGGIGDSEIWSKVSTSGLFLYVSSNVRSLLDLQPEDLVGTSIQELMRKESRPEFGRAIEKARRGKVISRKHEVQNRRGQVLQAQTILYPGDAKDGQRPTFLLAQTKLLKASSRAIAPATEPQVGSRASSSVPSTGGAHLSSTQSDQQAVLAAGPDTAHRNGPLFFGGLDVLSDDNIFDELRTTKCSSWQFELRQMEKVNRILAEELGGLLSNKKKRKRRKGVGNIVRDCANCHTRNTPEWRRGPSGQRDLCNSCGLRWAKQMGRVSPRNSSKGGNGGNGDSQSKLSNSPTHSSPLHRGTSGDASAEGLGGDAPKGVAGNGSGAGGNAASAPKANQLVPPLSQPLLEGGSGQEMTAIREERETSQS